MIFEAVVIAQSKNSFTVKQKDNGVVWTNVFLASLMLYSPAQNEYVLCTRSDGGTVYILGKIQGEWDDKYGLQLGNMTDNLTVTEDGVIRHIKGTNESIIDDVGCRLKFDKMEVEGLGWKITCEDGKLTIAMDPVGSEVIVDSPKITLASGTKGGIPTGSDYVSMINELKTIINALINLYNTHTHAVPGAVTSLVTTMQQTQTVTASPVQSTKVTSG